MVCRPERRIAAAVLCVALLGACDGDGEAPLGAERESEPATVQAAGTSPDDEPAAPTKLSLSIDGANGQPRAGRVVIAMGPDPAWLHGAVIGEGDPGVETRSHSGRITLEVSTDHWVVVRADADDGSSTFARFAPTRADRAERIVVDRENRALHVLVVRDDYRTPATNTPVRLYAARRAMQVPQLTETKRTDGHGYVRFDQLDAGSFVAIGPRVERGEDAPHAWRVRLGKDRPPSQAQSTIIRAPDRREVALQVDARFTPRYGVTPRIVLQRRDDGSGTRFVQPRRLEPGHQTVEMRVPAAGTYEVLVRPFSELTVADQSRIVDLQSGSIPAIHLTEPEERTTVELRGIEANVFPMRVYPQPVSDLLDDRPREMSWGKVSWSGPRESVPALAEPVRIVGFARERRFISAQPIRVGGSTVAVDMVPAVEVRVAWSGWSVERDAGSILIVEPKGGAPVARVLTPDFSIGRSRPVLLGTLILRPGKLRLAAQRPDGSEAWSREVDAAGPTEIVRVAN